MTNSSEALADAVAQATSREKFDVISFFSGTSLPTEKVTIYADTEAAYELNKIYDAERARADAAGSKKKKKNDDLSIADADPDVVDSETEEKIAEYRERLTKSAVTFHLRGLAPAARVAIEKSLKAKLNGDEEEYSAHFFGTLVAKTIQYVTNADGARDDSPWTKERVDELSENISAEAFNKLSEGVFLVTNAGNDVDRAVSADF